MRINGRKHNQIRKVAINRDYVKYAEGSCLIEVGNTKVICTASVEDFVPAFLKGSGGGWVTAEYSMIPRSCQSRIPRNKNSGRTQEIQRLIGRSLRAVVKMEALGERTIWLDCDVIQADGGTRTASITGSFVALVDCLSKLKQSGAVSELPIKDFVAAVSVGVVEGEHLLDLNYREDSGADVDMNVVMTGNGEFIEVQGTGEKASFTKGQMDELLELAKTGIEELVDMQRSLLKDVL